MCELIIKLPFSKNEYKIYILLYKSNDIWKCANYEKGLFRTYATDHITAARRRNELSRRIANLFVLRRVGMGHPSDQLICCQKYMGINKQYKLANVRL